MLQLRACSLPPQSLPRTEPELSSVAVSPPLRKPLVCHHERDRDHGLAERERARGTRWRKGKATTRRPLPAPDTSHHRPSTHPAGLAPRRDGGALCPTVYSSETSLRSCPSRLIDGALIFTLVFTRDTRPHINTAAHARAPATHTTHMREPGRVKRGKGRERGKVFYIVSFFSLKAFIKESGRKLLESVVCSRW